MTARTCDDGRAPEIPCDGVCVPGADIVWGSPFLVWLGEGPEMLACPETLREGLIWVAPGPATPCADCACESLIIGPLAVKEEGCAPKVPIIPKDNPVPWTAARACVGSGRGVCPMRDQICAPAAPLLDPLEMTPPGQWTPEGGVCSSVILTYEDSTCSTLLAAVTATSSAPMCVDVPAGAALGSKGASAPIYQAGACQPAGGDPSGGVEYVGAATFCCTD